MKETPTQLGKHIVKALKKDVTGYEVVHGELIIHAKAESIFKVMCFLHDDGSCQCKLLMDIAGVDYPGDEKRFEVVYQLLSTRLNQRIRVKARVNEGETIASVTAIFASAGWFEREAWDMYGIYFSGNSDLRRILTDYGFDGHPQRKDFPLTGYVEMRYDEEQKRVVYEPVGLQQAYRSFDFMSPWEGMDYILPGDEKAEKKAS
jgi:NADH-quinone oxidoreductase subunit C